MIAPSSLELRWATRPAGRNQTPRRFLDFIVDGRSLAEWLGMDTIGRITPLGWLGEADAAAVRQLLLEEPTVLNDDRPDFYVCAECADIDCGGVTARVERSGSQYLWHEFAYRWPNWEAPFARNEPGRYQLDCHEYASVGPFVFEATAYAAALSAARA